MSSFFHGQKFPFGLDIGDASLKAVQFGENRGRLQVEGFADVNFPPKFLADDALKNLRPLVDAIKQVITAPKFGKITSNYVVASIPEPKCFVRVIEMPQISETEAAEAVPWEAEAYIPIPVGQVYLDWMILDRPAKDGKMTVLIMASPKDYVDQYTSILKEAGLKPVALEVESQATARSLVSRKDETVLMVDIDTVRTSIIIYDRGTLEFTSSLPIAGNAFTESIAKGLTLDFAKSEELKREVGIGEGAKQAQIRKALQPILTNLIEEIKNTIRFHEEHSAEGDMVTRLLLAGASSRLKHLPSYLYDQLMRSQIQKGASLKSLAGLKVELGNPWVNVLQKGQTPPMSREDSLSYATAIGLALRGTERIT